MLLSLSDRAPLFLDWAALVALSLGALILLAAWLPLILRHLPLSLPIVAVGVGYAALRDPWMDVSIHALFQNQVLEHLSEVVILVALMGAGLRIERPFAWRKWQTTFRLLGIAMPLTLFAMAGLCWAAVGLPWASALLVGAALSPTDPVLAADVQAGPPGEEEGGEVRFGLTSEAGLNDGLAFPFVLLAMMLASTPTPSAWQQWVLIDVFWRIGCGALIGYGAGWLFGWLTFKLPRLKLSKTGDGLVAVGVTLVSYGATQLMGGYGFIAVFISAVTLRATDRGHGFHVAMAEFSEQIERVLMVIVLVIFGGAIAAGALREVGWPEILAAIAMLLFIRPLAGWISLIGAPLPAMARALLAFFGIRGLGTFYYMAYAQGHARFPDSPKLWSLVSLVVLTSVILHGVTSTPLMQLADRRRHRRSRTRRD